MAGCESSERNSEKADVGSIKVLTYGLDGHLGLTLNGTETLMATNWQDSRTTDRNTSVFKQLLKTGDTVELEVTQQPEGSYCEVKEEQSFIYDIEENSDFTVVCQAYGKAYEPALSVDTSPTHSCAKLEARVHCYSNNPRISRVPAEVVDPQLVKVGHGFSCAVQAGQLLCWGDDEYPFLTYTPPEIVGTVKELELDYASACLIDDEGLKCWGDETTDVVRDYPQELVSPRHLYLESGNACVVDSGAPYCWGHNVDQQGIPSDLTEVTDIAVDVLYGCAVENSAVVCWSNEDDLEVASVPEDLGRVSSIALGNFTACATTDNGLRCWGNTNPLLDQLILTEKIVPYPDELVISERTGCGIQEGELVCFGAVNGGYALRGF